MPLNQGALNKFNIPYGNPPPKETPAITDNPYLDEVKKIATARLASNALGLATGGDGHESVAAIVVKAAIDNTTKLAQDANAMAERKDTAAQLARDSADKSKEALYTLMEKVISKESDNLKSIIERLDKDKVAPRSVADSLTEVKTVMELINGFNSRQALSAPPPPQGSSSIELQLEQMRNAQAFALKQLEFQMAEADRTFRLQMLQFTEDTKWKREEHEENRVRGKETMNNLMDVAQSVVAATTGGKGEAGVQSKAVTHKVADEPDSDPGITASATKFPCQFCQELIDFSETGDKVACSNCGAIYNIARNK